MALGGAKVHAHYISFVFVAIAFVAGVALIIFGAVTQRMDRRREQAT